MMNSKITRRQVLRLTLVGSATLASLAVAVSGPMALPIFAGPATEPATSTVLLGVRAGTIPAGGAAIAVPVLVQSMDVATGQMQTVQVPQLLLDGTTPVLAVNESITGYAVLPDGTHVLAITPISGDKHTTEPTRLTRLSQSAATTVPISGLRRQEQLGSMIATSTGILLALIEKRNGTPPVRLVVVDPQTGAVSDYDKIHLPGYSRFTTLSQCPDGQLYATAVGKDGDTSLVQLDTGTTQLLTGINGDVWNNGLASLVCSTANQLLALGAPRYETPNALYTVDSNSGVMSRVRDFDVAKLTITLI